jgi:hypothetical protein
VSAAEALRAAREAGVDLRVDDQELVLQAPAPPPEEVLDLLSRHKTGVIALLRAAGEDWSAEEWHGFHDERAAIAEYDGGLSRQEAEALACTCCVLEWLYRNPVRSSPERCLGCGQSDAPSEPLLPFGTKTAGHAWLHHSCWGAWHAGRKGEAVADLAAMGIEDRSSGT